MEMLDLTYITKLQNISELETISIHTILSEFLLKNLESLDTDAISCILESSNESCNSISKSWNIDHFRENSRLFQEIYTKLSKIPIFKFFYSGYINDVQLFEFIQHQIYFGLNLSSIFSPISKSVIKKG
jgi:hypothetical protein